MQDSATMLGRLFEALARASRVLRRRQDPLWEPFSLLVVRIAVALLVMTSVQRDRDAQAAENAKSAILMFDPEANHQDLSNLVAVFNRFLGEAGLGQYGLRVFRRLEDFEASLVSDGSRYVIVSSEYIRDGRGAKLVPALVPEADNSVYFKKVVVDLGGSAKGDLRKKTVAGAAVGETPQDSQTRVIVSLKEAGIKTDGVRVLRVSKDIDGLLALSFGSADAAVAAPGSIEVFGELDPTTEGRLRKVGQTKGVLRAPLCLLQAGEKRAPSKDDPLVQALLSMGDLEVGREAMRYMGVQRWVQFEPWMLKP